MIHTAGRARRAAVFLLALLLPASAAAEWRRLDSPNFIVVGDAGERELRNIAVQFEGFRETLGRVLSANVTATAVPTVVIVFPNDRAFTPYKPLYNGKPVAVGGVFYPGREVNYITLVSDGRPGSLRVIFHEYAHLVISNVAMNLPVWLNEGLAEYYSTYEYARGGREAVIGRTIASHLQRLGEKPLLPLEQLIGVNRTSSLYNEGDRRSLFYAQSWALTHMLLLGEPSRLNELAAFIRDVQAGAPEAEAWRKAFGAARIDRELDQYVRRRVFRAYAYTFTDRVAKFEAAAVPLPDPDVSAFLAGLRVRQLRHADAETLLAAALKAGSRQHAGIVKARIEIDRGDFDAAATRLTTLGKADDWWVAYSAGTALTDLIERSHDTTAERLTAARGHLGALGPGREWPNALADLALLDILSPDGPTAAGRAAIERARMLAPGRDDYALIHARLLAEMGDFALARKILGPLMTPTFPEHVRDTARRWMANVVRMEESRKRAEAPRSAAPTAAGSEDVSRQQRPEQPVIPVFREGQPGDHRLEGVLERINCPPGGPATFHVRTNAGVETVEAAKLEEVDFITYRDDLTGNVACGPLKQPMRVYVTWREGAKAGTRRAVAVEFLPR